MEVTNHDSGFEILKDSLKRKVVYLENVMVTVIEFSNGPMEQPDSPHKHQHEQISYVASGSLKLFIEDREYVLNKGDVFKVESNLNHCIQTLSENVTLVDSFSPIRKDFL